MSAICNDCCNLSSSQVIELVYEVYNAFVDAQELFANFEQKKCKLLNLYQEKIAKCLNADYAHWFDVSECGEFQLLKFIGTIGTNAVNLVVYFDGVGYILLNQGGCRLRYDNARRVSESVVTRDIEADTRKDRRACLDCEIKTDKLYCYDQKKGKVVSECKLVKKPAVKILSPSKCQNIGKSICLRFDVLDFNFCGDNQALIFIDDVEYVALKEVIPVSLHFKCHGKHKVSVKLWDQCEASFVAEACVDVKVCDSSSSSSSSCDSSSTSTSCTECDNSTTTSCTSTSSSCKPCQKKDKHVKKVTCYKSDTTSETDTSSSGTSSTTN